jgi:hypothetical protein
MDNREEDDVFCCCWWSGERDDDDNVDTKLIDRCRIDDDKKADRDNPRGPAPTAAPEKAAAIIDDPLRRNPLPRSPIMAILTSTSKRCVLARKKLKE